jgi:hypothetical protein
MDAQTLRHESPEQLIDVFKAAALSVTKLYRSSVATESRARQDGYQDCLDDLLAFIERESTSTADVGFSKVRKWASDRRDGRDTTLLASESEDEVDKGDSNTSPVTTHPVNDPTSTTGSSAPPRHSSTESSTTEKDDGPPQHFVVPSQDFTFQSEHQYPNIATLDLSDTRAHGGANHAQQRTSRNRGNRQGLRPGPLGRGAGAKRRMDFNELFGGCLSGKDPFGNGNKRGRHN